MPIKFSLHWADHDASEEPRWYAEYFDTDGPIDDSEKVWHPAMPTEPDAEDQARAIAEAYALKLTRERGATREQRCAECQAPEHDICPLVHGCPCCADTRERAQQ